MNAFASGAAIEALAGAVGALTVEAAPDGADAPLLAAATRKRGGTTLYVARDEARAVAFEAAVRFFAPDLEVLRLPSWDSPPYDRISPGASVAAERCAVLAKLARRGPDAGPLLVVATATGVAQRAPPRARLAQAVLEARVGGALEMDDVSRFLETNGYGRAPTVRSAGEYAVRGGLIDVFPPGAAEPLRFDFFGDTLESLRAFDADTQRTTRALQSAVLSPVSEVILDDASVQHFRKSFAQAFGAVQDAYVDAVSARIRKQGIEQFLPFFYERLETVFAFVGERALIAFEALAEDAMKERAAAARDHYETRRGAPTPRGAQPFRAPAPELFYIEDNALREILIGRSVRRFTPFDSTESSRIGAGVGAGRDFSPERQTADANVFDAVVRHAKQLMTAGKRVVFAAWTEGSAERLSGVLADHGLESIARVSSWAEAEALAPKTATMTILPIERGYESPKAAVISEQDVLGDRLVRQRRRRRAANIIAEAAALSPGDLIVHEDHGIARYEGLKTLDVQGAPHDCLDLTYAGGDKLYLPVENIELVTRYGAEDSAAQLDKLGGVAWQSRKARAKQRLRDMAAELIKIAAMRAQRTAEVVTPPEGAWDEFCARFPYEETDDQLAAIDDVLSDLGSGHPMDRLICGDVGFGKTEVALRAAFLVAMSGRQVAVIAPTTLLVRQHFRTFTERFRGLPNRVRQLSRLVSAKEASETRKALEAGEIDIVVGTHALLAKQVSFRDLGLLIIDEEQHFGVKHKERLKEMRGDVHVLTLSATPIPRTLQSALAGIREMSIIATPPIDRMAVRTYVAPFDGVTVREALLKERYRGGQSFFVTPRIADLEELAKFLRDQVPELTFALAHGQMAASALDELMTSFYDGQFDVLLSTSIVESGLDVPRANTLIVHRADMFGLAQLYQLRGRVGRSKIRAFAYLTTPPDQKLTDGAEKRLRVLASLDNLGAGFTLASHDLDMRGGGNLLGEEQSGHIREVGVELYQSMLEEAVLALKAGGGEEVSERSWSPQINVGAAVLIPEDYVRDLTVRLGLYRRLSELATDQEREGYAAELIDRFGPLPLEADQLISVAALKAQCRQAMIAKVDAGPKGAVLTFRDTGFPDPAALVLFVQKNANRFRLRPDGRLVVQGDWPEAAERLKALRSALDGLVSVLARRAA